MKYLRHYCFHSIKKWFIVPKQIPHQNLLPFVVLCAAEIVSRIATNNYRELSACQLGVWGVEDWAPIILVSLNATAN